MTEALPRSREMIICGISVMAKAPFSSDHILAKPPSSLVTIFERCSEIDNMGTVTKTPAVNGSTDCQSYQRRSRGIRGRLHKQIKLPEPQKLPCGSRSGEINIRTLCQT